LEFRLKNKKEGAEDDFLWEIVFFEQNDIAL
jgi:hypothetical protein